MSHTTATDKLTLRIGHSPDADDAFMWWAITPRGDAGPHLVFDDFQFEVVMQDIESLNRRSLDGDLDITAISAAQYPSVADRFVITACGASFGRQYGPKFVTRTPMTLADIAAVSFPIAVPGARTTAALTCAMAVGCPRDRLVPAAFDEIGDRVAGGEFEAGVIIHEGQLTYERLGLHLVADLGEWWHDQTALPLPLGLNVIRRDLVDRLGADALSRVTTALAESIRAGLEHRAEAVEYARQFGRGIDEAIADRFVEMYVNPLTIDCGEAGRRGITALLTRAASEGLVPSIDSIDIVHPVEPTG